MGTPVMGSWNLSGFIQETIFLRNSKNKAHITYFLSACLKVKVGHPVDQVEQTEGSWKEDASI